MNTFAISTVVFICLGGGVLFGAFIRTLLSEKHLNPDAKDVVKMATALIVTLSALVLALLLATAKSTFDAKNTQVRQLTSNVILLDQLLAQYGPETTVARQIERRSLDGLIDSIWSEGRAKTAGASPFEISRNSEAFVRTLFALSPSDDAQRALKTRLIQSATDIAQLRLSLYVQSGNTISIPFLTILVFWLTMIFTVFSLLTRLNTFVVIILIGCALSVSGSIFLILDLDQPFNGMMQISSLPLRNSLSPLAP